MGSRAFGGPSDNKQRSVVTSEPSGVLKTTQSGWSSGINRTTRQTCPLQYALSPVCQEVRTPNCRKYAGDMRDPMDALFAGGGGVLFPLGGGPDGADGEDAVIPGERLAGEHRSMIGSASPRAPRRRLPLERRPGEACTRSTIGS